MELAFRNHSTDRTNVVLAGTKHKFLIEIRDVAEQAFELQDLIVLCQLTGVNGATINGVQCLQTTASCRWTDFKNMIAETEFSITPQEVGDITIVFSVQRGGTCKPITAQLKSIAAPAHSAFMPRITEKHFH